MKIMTIVAVVFLILFTIAMVSIAIAMCKSINEISKTEQKQLKSHLELLRHLLDEY